MMSYTQLYASGPVCDITLEDDFLYWASHGSVSYYEVEISGNTSVHTTTEQLFPLAKTLSGNFSIEVHVQMYICPLQLIASDRHTCTCRFVPLWME